ncbi:MAG TPA: ornithine cyclodeaminase family protein [Terrimesophilobacter sp.]|nr:ornithine cyclodeaminase family protein [Terrimesophilobacter sp.]
MTTPAIPWISADEVYRRVSFGDAVQAYHRDLRAGVDPAKDLPKHIDNVHKGQVLLMPTQSEEFLGVKVVTVAPGNPELGLERIQGHYLLFDTPTLTPIAIMDGVALTTLRTPAVSAAAADLLAPEECEHMVIFGYGPQAWGHVEALRSIRDIKRITLVARNMDRAQVLADQVTESGIPTTVGSADDVKDAQLIVAATTAREPVFDGSLAPIDSCVMAVGSHELDARELDSGLIARSQVIVEDIGHVQIEGGDIMMAIGDGAITLDHVSTIRELVTGTVEVDRTRTRVFKSSGMPWEDLVIAAEVFRRG